MTPEQRARQNIDRQLAASGWVVQDRQGFNPGAGVGIAVREYPTDTGNADYVLFLNRRAVGVIEAKPEGEVLTVKAEGQAQRYATSEIKWQINQETLPFVYQSTGTETRFYDNRDPKPRSREVFTFHRPETLEGWLRESDTLRTRLQQLPPLDSAGLRECQVRAINNLEQSFAEARPRALVQMATGSGKTFTAITSIYRLLKFAGAKRILFLVDTRNLGIQAEQEMQAYVPNDDRRVFSELYNVQRLRSNTIDPVGQVCISTIQRMYSILRGVSLDESAEEQSLYENGQNHQAPQEVAYNPAYPIEFFDVIIIDECHRSIYNIWKQVLDYFDAFLIGLTATPDNRTFGFFHQNVVSEYSHETAVADGVNVGYDVYTIETQITREGARIAAQAFVDKRSRQTRQKRWEQLDEEVVYSGTQLDRDVVNPSQIRTVIRTFKEKLPEIFPHRREVPKTLIFAKTDSHADDIIQIVREEFGEGNDFCKKVTYRVRDERPEDVLQAFRTAYYPRIAVTVDMIATGTDVKPLECLLFMRDVRSRSYFEQMKGRGTRTFGKDELRRVTPSAAGNKSHFVIIDAVGVTESLKTDSRPLERKPGASFSSLLEGVVMNFRDEDTLTSLANRLARLDRELAPAERREVRELAAGKTLGTLVHGLLDAYNPDRQLERAREIQLQEGLPPEHAGVDPDLYPPSEVQLEAAREILIREACDPFDDPALRRRLLDLRTQHDQVIDEINLDQLREAGFTRDRERRARELIEGFSAWIEAHKDAITALQILYDQPQRRRSLTYAMIRELREALLQSRPQFAPAAVWGAYRQLENPRLGNPASELAALVALVRRISGRDGQLTPLEETVNRNFRDWVFRKNAGPKQFSEAQMDWLRLIKEHIIISISIEKEDLDNTPFFEKGGLMKAWQLFGEELDPVLDEMNRELVA